MNSQQIGTSMNQGVAGAQNAQGISQMNQGQVPAPSQQQSLSQIPPAQMSGPGVQMGQQQPSSQQPAQMGQPGMSMGQAVPGPMNQPQGIPMNQPGVPLPQPGVPLPQPGMQMGQPGMQMGQPPGMQMGQPGMPMGIQMGPGVPINSAQQMNSGMQMPPGMGPGMQMGPGMMVGGPPMPDAMRHHPQQQPAPGVVMTPQQLHLLRLQIMAYKCISRNQPLPDNVRMALEAKRNPMSGPLGG